jgi:DNA-binding NtrC family response regulator
VGRGEKAGMALEPDNKEQSLLSRKHAWLGIVDGKVVVRDTDSSNGTFVNGELIAAETQVRLEPGDILRIGKWIGLVALLDDTDVKGTKRVANLGSKVELWGGRAMSEALEPLRHLSPDAIVVVVGETGTGKELVAKEVHERGKPSERKGPFRALNCSRITKGFEESTLFGIGKGVATGCHPAEGYFRAANNGTLLLDEFAELEPGIQAMLLRVVEDREVPPMGCSGDHIKVDVQLVVTVQLPLEELVKAGRLRPDLMYRLNQIVVRLPPLRERRADIPWLMWHFFEEELGADVHWLPDPRFVERICLYDWPGNVRELKNEAERLCREVPRAEHRSNQSPFIFKESLLSEPIRARKKPEPAVSKQSPTAGDEARPNAERLTAGDIMSLMRVHDRRPDRVIQALGITPDEFTKTIARLPIDLQVLMGKDGIERLIAHYGGNTAAAARSSGIHVNTLKRWRKTAPDLGRIPDNK